MAASWQYRGAVAGAVARLLRRAQFCVAAIAHSDEPSFTVGLLPRRPDANAFGSDLRMPSRRKFLAALLSSAAISGVRRVLSSESRNTADLIDRESLVRRHDPVNTNIDPLSALSLGNGRFAFTADVTGLQTLHHEYEEAMPLCTMSEWGWHTTPRPTHLVGQTLKPVLFDTHGRQVGYHTSSEGQTELFNWLRENPHRLHLGRICFFKPNADDGEISSAEIAGIVQELDLWSGVLTSKFRFSGDPVEVRTAVHPSHDLLAVSVKSELLKRDRIGVALVFPYGSSSMQAADWDAPQKHETKVVNETASRLDMRRILDDDSYVVSISAEGAATITRLSQHSFVVWPKDESRLVFTVFFSREMPKAALPNVQTTFSASARHWHRFWSTGGAVDLSDSKDKRSEELERRVVLSQYLTAIQCSGNLPPQETGLTINSWYGKFHLEMHWWHAAHFALWNRLPLFERSLDWYNKILPQARELARSQGYAGVRWPKMVGPEGSDSPSSIGPLLIWQQPHPIFYAELCYLSHPNRATLNRYADIVFESARFMSSYAFFDASANRYVLGPPVIPVQENHPPRETWNPTFELAYWKFGLRIAQRWRERLGMQRLPKWDQIIEKLSALPVRDGVYLAHENCPQTFTQRNVDHPSMLGALGFLSGDDADPETMRRTLAKTLAEWRWDQTWGWDYPLTAMTAARLGESKKAVDALLMVTEKNRYLPNGHNYQRANLPCYLPGNGGLLYATALMSVGWKGSPRTHAPGFPNDGKWKIRAEGFNSSLAGNL